MCDNKQPFDDVVVDLDGGNQYVCALDSVAHTQTPLNISRVIIEEESSQGKWRVLIVQTHGVTFVSRRSYEIQQEAKTLYDHITNLVNKVDGYNNRQ